ncbi:MAG: hypothetical protein OXG24_02520 [Gammaproteobacteria bacterium]|nr:hypothetical protein [Gammaproteobacteria bacterium]
MQIKFSTTAWTIVAALILAFGTTALSADEEAEMKTRVTHDAQMTKFKMKDSAEDGGEESGAQYMLDETYDEIRRGARLVLKYEPKKEAFMGKVSNTTEKTLRRVRVEVHLSNGTELGPTTPKDLEPKESMEVMLAASGQKFKTWGAHPEIGGAGAGEHSGSHGDREHGSAGEHGRKVPESGGEHGAKGRKSDGEHN